MHTIHIPWPNQGQQLDWVENFQLVEAWLTDNVGLKGTAWSWSFSRAGDATILVEDERMCTWILLNLS